MVATTVLFDRGVTFGTLLCVGGYPVGRLRIIFTFLEPFFDNGARRGLVIVEDATEAEMVTAVTVHRWDDTGKFAVLDLAVDRIYAARCRAPFEILEVIDIGSSE